MHERKFVSNAMAFFVGWCHISWIQDLSTLTAVGLGQHGWAWGAIGQVFLVFIFGPVLTVVVVAGNSALHRRFSSAARVEGRAELAPAPAAEAVRRRMARAAEGRASTRSALLDARRAEPRLLGDARRAKAAKAAPPAGRVNISSLGRSLTRASGFVP